jgi:uroporphyrinogen decarboxylase
MRYESVDRRPLYLVSIWDQTLTRWQQEGLPPDVDVHQYLGLNERLTLRNLSGHMGPHPVFETHTVWEDEEVRISIDEYGRKVRDFKTHMTMPEWIEFPVKDRDTLEQFLNEHYSIERLVERFDKKWEESINQPQQGHELTVLDGGCYYWTLRSIAGVEVASYLFYDAPDLVDELFERYFTVVMEGMRRVLGQTRVDVIAFGEDIGFKTGPLISPATFRRFILPYYRKALEYARSQGVELTWYDSDGDVRALIPDYLDAGINGLCPCEVAAGMAPLELRNQYGRELRLIGGIDKRQIAKGREAIDAELERNRPLLEEGGYIPAIDHSVPDDISFDNYRYFVEKLMMMLDV